MTQVCYRGVDFLYTTMYFDWFMSVVNFASKRLPSELNAFRHQVVGRRNAEKVGTLSQPGWWW